MRNCLAAVLIACSLLSAGTAPLALADPPADPNVQLAADPAPGPPGAVQSAPPGIVTTPDGWELTVVGRNEFQVAIAPLTTATSSREYLVAGTFVGRVEGSGSSELSGGTLEVGYQIGCGITLNVVKLNTQLAVEPSVGVLSSLLGDTKIEVLGQIEVFPQPGEVINVEVERINFEGTKPRVTLKDIHVKIDGCIGESFLRSYAVLTSSTDEADDIVAYYGVPKAV